MALEDILKKIDEDADAEIKQLNEKLAAREKHLAEQFAAKQKQEIETAEKEAAAAASAHRERLVNHARYKAGLEVLSRKQELVKTLFDNAMKKIESLPANEKVNKFAAIAAAIGETEGTLIVGEKDNALNSASFIDAVRKKLPDSKLTLETSPNITGGFVLRAGRVLYDNTITSLSEQAKEHMQDKLIRMLFA